MKAKEFYRLLSAVNVADIRWRLTSNGKEVFGVPNYSTRIMGVCHNFYYSPLSVVASAVKRQFVDRGNPHINKMLHLDARTFRRITDASSGRPGLSPRVRRKLEKAVGLLHAKNDVDTPSAFQ